MFEIGDIVTLNSDYNVLMTIIEIDLVTNECLCTWFDEANKAQQKSYPSQCLKKSENRVQTKSQKVIKL